MAMQSGASLIQTLHRARKARLACIAARAVEQAAPAPAPASVAPRRLAPSRRRGRRIDDEHARAVEVPGISQHDQFPQASLRIDDIQRATVRHFGILRDDMLTAQRLRQLTRPRQVAMYLARKLTAKSFAEIGRCFGRDHTAVLYAVSRIEDLVAKDAKVAGSVDRIRTMLGT